MSRIKLGILRFSLIRKQKTRNCNQFRRNGTVKSAYYVVLPVALLHVFCAAFSSLELMHVLQV